MYVRSVQIKNLRAFKEGTLEFLYPGRKLASDPFISGQRQDLNDPRHQNINVVLGSNGSGKSTVLDAIAMAMISPMTQTGFVPQALIRRTKGRPPVQASVGLEIVIHSTDTSQIAAKKSQIAKLDCTVGREGNYEFLGGPPIGDELYKEFFLDRSPAFFVVGYGVFRRIDATTQADMQSRTTRRPRYDRVVTLFDDNVPLIALSNWFPTLEAGPRRIEVVSLINKATPKTVRFDGKVDANNEMMFRYRGLELPFAALSDGYRGHLGWLGDMLYRMQEVAPPGMKLGDLPGVVLVDEIDAHLHPVWQQEIIGALSRAFPSIQFIFTTHSPLITGTLERANINVVSRTGLAAPVVSPPDEEMYGLSADQILMTDLFGLNTARDQEFAKELRALEVKAASGSADASVEFIRKAAIGKAAENYPKGEEREIPDWLRKMAAKQ
jgi:energy-coupling factor transporter ATP-binding protein EcfA2